MNTRNAGGVKRWVEDVAMKLLDDLSIDVDAWEMVFDWVMDNTQVGEPYKSILRKARRWQQRQMVGRTIATELIKVARELTLLSRAPKWNPGFVANLIQSANKAMRDGLFGTVVSNLKQAQSMIKANMAEAAEYGVDRFILREMEDTIKEYESLSKATGSAVKSLDAVTSDLAVIGLA